jgi:hypothetical protein
VIDGVGACCSSHGYDSNSNDDWNRLVDEVLKPLCATGAAVILVDHVAKGQNANRAYPIGASQKLARCRGAAYEVTSVSDTVSKLVVRKDTNGQIGALGSTVAELVLEEAGSYSPRLQLRVPADGRAGSTTNLAGLMAKARQALEREDGLTLTALRDAVGGRRELAVQAIDQLIAIGAVRTEAGAGNARHHHLVVPDGQSS